MKLIVLMVHIRDMLPPEGSTYVLASLASLASRSTPFRRNMSVSELAINNQSISRSFSRSFTIMVAGILGLSRRVQPHASDFRPVETRSGSSAGLVLPRYQGQKSRTYDLPRTASSRQCFVDPCVWRNKPTGKAAHRLGKLGVLGVPPFEVGGLSVAHLMQMACYDVYVPSFRQCRVD